MVGVKTMLILILQNLGFYELIPILLKTEHVVLQGNNITPLELKIFAGQLRLLRIFINHKKIFVYTIQGGQGRACFKNIGLI